MRKSINLHNFCDPTEYREHLREPVNFGDMTLACNGHIAIAVPKQDEFNSAPEDYGERLTELMKSPSDKFLAPDKDISFPSTEVCNTCRGCGNAHVSICDECSGEGVIDFDTDYNDYEVTCKGCRGDGREIRPGGDKTCTSCKGKGRTHKQTSYVTVSGIHLNPLYAQMIFDIENVEIFPAEDERKLYFQAGEVHGVVMGMRV